LPKDRQPEPRSAQLIAGPQLSRRGFLRTSTLVGGLAVASCTAPQRTVPAEQDIGAPHRHPTPPSDSRAPGVYEFFTRAEARVVEAVAARIIPGDEDDPGAREAGVINYIDGKLAEFAAFAEPTFVQPPFAEAFRTSPSEVPDGAVAVAELEINRYGFQSDNTPQDIYRDGLPGLDRYARRRFGADFVDLPEDQQDQVLTVLDGIARQGEGGGTEDAGQGGSPGSGGGQGSGSGSGPEADAATEDFGDVDPGVFFDMVRTDTIEGMFADPVYGGNRGLVGWTMLGYPGPQRAFSPEEMLTGSRRQAQSLDGLPPMNPDRPHRHGEGALEQPRSGVGDG
jgi:gluconate 2-dehydrogenase gamma chain